MDPRDPQTPDAPEGLRPEADANLVRPSEQEEVGPIPGLLGASADMAEDEIDPDTTVEEEGIAAGQIVGLTFAILASIACLCIVAYFFFYTPKLNATNGAAMDGMEQSVEGMTLRAEAEAAMGGYGMTADSSYRMPVEMAMQEVAARYATTAAEAAEMPATRQRLNLMPVKPTTMGARMSMSPSDTDPGDAVDLAPDAETNAEVGVDDVDAPGDDVDTAFPSVPLTE